MSSQPRCVCGETAVHRLHRMTKWGDWRCPTCLERTIYSMEDRIDDLDRQLDRALPSTSGGRSERSMSKRILATFAPQTWVNDGAVDGDDGAVEFDCTDQIVRMGREAALQVRDNRDKSDALVPPEILAKHSGPFRVEVESAIQAYFAEGESPP